MARLISWLLNVVYLAIVIVASPFIVWQAFRTNKYREGFREKLLGLVPRREGDATCVWIHAVSVGEVNLMATLIRELRAAHADWQFVISTTSRTGHELAKKKYSDLTVFYCPLDFSWAVENAMQRIRPTMLILAELELWPNLILAAKRHGARVAIVNGRLSDHSFPGYRRIRPFIAAMLRKLDLVAAQNQESADRFLALGAPADRVHATGSLKFDGAQTDRSNARTQSLRTLAGIAEEDIVLLAGSTQEPEEQIAIDVFRRLAAQHPRLRLILVPRHPERFDDVANTLDHSSIPWQRRSSITSQPPALPGVSAPATHRVAGVKPKANPQHAGTATNWGLTAFDPSHPTASLLAPRSSILLVDTVGELGAWWGTAHIAFVGGSFGNRGGQNMIEPAAYGAAVSFGPNTWNFRDIVAALAAADAAVVVNDDAALEAFVRRCLDDPQYAASLGQRAQALVKANLGATARTIELLDSLRLTHVSSTTVRSAA